jgi:uncharacterized membrane protein
MTRSRLMTGGWTWFLIDVVFVAVLAAMLVYGLVVTRRRQHDRRAQRRTDEATRQLYRDEARRERQDVRES